jgi:intein-encoded DNA endonuclease-like protein
MSISSPQSFNRYSYVNNDPVNKVDPTGLMLSDIGVYQTDNSHDAQVAEHQSLRDLQTSVNSDYAKRHGGTVNYKGNHASFKSNSHVYSTNPFSSLYRPGGNVAVSATVNGGGQGDQPIEELVSVVIWARPTRGLKGWNPVFAFGMSLIS